jgi:hypothetical protein
MANNLLTNISDNSQYTKQMVTYQRGQATL